MRAIALAFLVTACAHAPRGPQPWVVTGAGAAKAKEALDYVEAARQVYPGKLDKPAAIHFAPYDIDVYCYGPSVDRRWVVTGCAMPDGLAVAWPTLNDDCHTLACSALPHELAHRAGAKTEADAEAGVLKIIAQKRRQDAIP